MSATAGQSKIVVQVHANASRNEVVGMVGGVLKVKIAAPPVEGKANKRLIEFLCARLEVSKSRISIIKGETSRNKIIVVEGLDGDEVMKRLLPG